MAGPGVDNLSVFFLAQGEQTADAVMARLTTFIRAAKETLDLAVYDMRFSDPLRTQLASALRERSKAACHCGSDISVYPSLSPCQNQAALFRLLNRRLSRRRHLRRHLSPLRHAGLHQAFPKRNF